MESKKFVLCTAVLLLALSVSNHAVDAAQSLNCYTCDTTGQLPGFDTNCHKPSTQMTCKSDASCAKIEYRSGGLTKGCLSADSYGTPWHHKTECNGAMGQIAVGSGVLALSIMSYVLVKFTS
ncbi:hypothetical protein M3Y94_00036000 [Aphelenchoides besseyi]|nr:hypothetical protein M3Y94_00036000 [Aphelenchoides besseyi]